MQPAVEDAIREHLAKVLASAEFQNSERLCRFLRFIVDAKLRGEQDRVKEYLIGNEVFDRGEGYDPRLDPIVRVEARRLRKKLEAYYEGPGSGDAIRFDLPKGAYVPEIRQPGTAVAEPMPVIETGRRWTMAIAFLLFFATAAGFYFWPRRVAGPVVAIVPARWIWTGNDFPDLNYDEDLAERAGSKLAADRGFRIVAWPSIQRFRSNGGDTRQLASEFHAGFMIIVAVRVESDGFRVTSYLIDPNGGRKLSVYDQRGVPLDKPSDREQAAAQLAESSRLALKDAEKLAK
ncbi:MAG TPA: hypothetical protein VGL53_18140 [Bryobacteraceae bacterium]